MGLTRDYSRLYDPNSSQIIPKYNIGDLLFNVELDVVVYLIKRKFIGIKNYSHKEANEILDGNRPELETWYYKFKCVGNFQAFINVWKTEPEVDAIIRMKEWKYQPIKIK